MKQEILQLAIELYKDLQFYKRWSVKKYYLSNNWDVTGEWEKCLLYADTVN